MTTPTCNHCGQSEPALQRLVHPPTGEALRLCVPCLRALARAKAAWADEHGRERLVTAAKRDGQGLWRADHVLYLLPDLPGTKASSRTPSQPPAPVGER